MQAFGYTEENYTAKNIIAQDLQPAVQDDILLEFQRLPLNCFRRCIEDFTTLSLCKSMSIGTN